MKHVIKSGDGKYYVSGARKLIGTWTEDITKATTWNRFHVASSYQYRLQRWYGIRENMLGFSLGIHIVDLPD